MSVPRGHSNFAKFCLFSKFYLQILALISSFQDYFLDLDSPICFPLFFDCFLYDAFLCFGIILSRFHFASYTPSFVFCILWFSCLDSMFPFLNANQYKLKLVFCLFSFFCICNYPVSFLDLFYQTYYGINSSDSHYSEMELLNCLNFMPD